MSVQYVSGATNNGGSTAGTSLTVTYSPTAGNTIVAGIMFNGAVTGLTCKDQNSNALTLVTNKNNCYQFQGTAITGATSYKFAWTTSVKNAGVVAEYSGVNAIGTNGTNSGSTAPATISVTSTRNWSVIVSVFGVGGNVTTFTQSSGNLRLQVNAGAGNASAIALVDNLGYATGTSITDATGGVGTFTWNAIGVELYPNQTVPTDEWDNDAENQDNFSFIASPNAYFGSSYSIDGDLQDYGVEQISYSPGVIMDWSNDGENQRLLNQDYTPDSDTTDYIMPILPAIGSIKDTILMGWKGYSISNPSKDHGNEWTNYIVPVVSLIDYTWDADSENQRQQLMQFSDQLFEGIEQSLPLFDLTWDNPADYQQQQLDAFRDQLFEGVEQNIPVLNYNIWDTDAILQRQQDPYALDVFDERNELPIIPVMEWDNDTENQLLQLIYTIDRFTDDIKIQIPSLTFWENDQEQQQQQSSYTPDKALLEESVFYLIIPILDYTWDNDGENQLQWQLWNQDAAVDTALTRLIIPVVAYDTDAENQLSQGTYAFNQLFDDIKIQIPSLTFWEIDGENQIQQLGWNLDVFDERPNYLIIPVNVWDSNEQENQKQQDSYTPEKDLTDTSVEYITLPYNPWDTDSDQQLSQLLWNRDTQEEKEFTNYVIIPLIVQEDIQQLVWVDWIKDHLSDEMVERIQVIVISDYTWDDDQQIAFQPWNFDIQELQAIQLLIPVIDSDVEQQKQMYLQLNDDVLEANVANIILPPFIDIVEVVGEDEE